MAAGKKRSARERTLLKRARINLISRTARIWSRLNRELNKDLKPVVRSWVSWILKAAERSIDTGDLSDAPPIPEKATALIWDTIRAALAQGYWLQHIYMRECQAAVTGGTYKGRVMLSDMSSDDSVRDALEAFMKSRKVKDTADWYAIIPKDAVEWLSNYTPTLAGVLEQDVLKKVRDVIQASMSQGTTLAQRMDDLRAASSKIERMADLRVEMIARTEITRADSMGRLIEMKNNPDVLGVEFNAILDDRVTQICEHRHGLVMRLDDPRLPSNTPPLHVNCRSTLIPATVYEYPDGLLTSKEFDDVPESLQRETDIEEIQKLLAGGQEEFGQVRDGSVSVVETPAAPVISAKTEQVEEPPRAIPRAKSIREANRIAVEYGIADKAHFNGLDVDVANEIIETLAKTMERFPEFGKLDMVGSLSNHLKAYWELDRQARLVEFRRRHPGVPDKELLETIEILYPRRLPTRNALAMSFEGQGIKGISFNEKYFASKNLGEAATTFKRCDDKKWHPVGCGNLKATIDHEIGHQLDTLLLASHDELMVNLFNELSAQGKEAMTDALSGYAYTNIQEFIAEGWSEYCNNPNPRPTAKKIGELLIEMYERDFGV